MAILLFLIINFLQINSIKYKFGYIYEAITIGYGDYNKSVP
uniref:Uncharacterized protein n=1 Tax=uncultured Desulfobacterium sp. TaxID=201089 RepID=E1YMM5_9BACT|nr:unknown protein [uncultured Desulfobacterium sp.]